MVSSTIEGPTPIFYPSPNPTSLQLPSQDHRPQRVMYDAYTLFGEPTPTNKQYNSNKIFSHPDITTGKPWYGIQQKFIPLHKNVRWPIE
ncbi:glutamine synthetase nodule isozyme-like [Olea europaea var. sylvestris]|uniref:glutamine synthetase nodule isozyme-like n=1 Tax=Olea europaea var. sylvestris TaxID=158386 RepID=UPI000C1D3019|nr:glutamine synthetase nodule isozyme-like [Olea europaea var. sylvestris]